MGRPAGTGKRKRPSLSVIAVAGDVGVGLPRGDLRARDDAAGRIGDAPADAGVVDGFLSGHAHCGRQTRQDDTRTDFVNTSPRLKTTYVAAGFSRPTDVRLKADATTQGV